MPERDVAVVLADAAASDIQSIYRHVAETGSVAVADGVYARLFEAIARLGEHPESGAPRDHVRAGYRIVLMSSWVIWYRYQPSERRVVVMRVLHGHMDAVRHLPG